MRRLIHRLQFALESLLSQGPLSQLAAAVALVVALSLLGGWAFCWLSNKPLSYAQAVWWAFLHLTDPGYLGADRGVGGRVVATLLTLAGYVVFVGAVVTITTTSLHQVLQGLSSGRSPLYEEDHILILGHSPLMHVLIEELVHADQRLGGKDRLTVAILTPSFHPQLGPELIRRLERDVLRRCRVLVRSGNPLEGDSLARVDAWRSRSILILRPEGPRAADIDALKVLINLKSQSAQPTQLRSLVLEAANGATAYLAESLGWGCTEAVVLDALVGRILCQAMRNPGLSVVYDHLLSDRFGESILLVGARELELESGLSLREVFFEFSHGVPLGFVRSGEPRLLALDEPLQPDDEVVLLAASSRHVLGDHHAGRPLPIPPPTWTATSLGVDSARARNIMIVGWNSRAEALLDELSACSHEVRSVRLVSWHHFETLANQMERLRERHPNLKLELVRERPLREDQVARLNPGDFDHLILLSCLPEDLASSDAETAMACVLFQRALKSRTPVPSTRILCELNDPDNERLFQSDAVSLVISPQVSAHILAQIASRRVLSRIYEELFSRSGAELRLAPCAPEDGPAEALPFERWQVACLMRGAVALGYRPAEQPPVLNPDRSVLVGPEDHLIVLERHD